MAQVKRWQVVFLVLLPLLLTFVYLNGGDFVMGVLICLCLIAGCFCSFVLNKPELGILSILVALAFTDRQAPNLLYSFQLIYFVVAISFIHHFLSHATSRKFFWFFVVLICSYHISVLIVRPYLVPAGWLLYYMTNLAIFLWSILIKWNVRKIMNIIIPYLIYLIAYGFIEKLIYDPLRVGGPTTHATNYAVILTFLWTIWFIESYLSKRYILLVLIFASSIVLFTVFLSGTRMGLLGIFAGLFGAFGAKIWINNLHKPLLKKLLYIASIFLVIVISVYVIWPFLPQSIYLVKSWNILLSGNLDSGSMGRVIAWTASLDSFFSNPIWGVGPGNFIKVYTGSFEHIPLTELSSIPELEHAHSIGLNVLAENGLLGAMMLATVIITCWLQLLKYLLNNPRSPLGYALLFGGVVIFCLPMIDMIPSPGWDSWYYGILASFGLHKLNSQYIDSCADIEFSEQNDKLDIKSISQHS